MDEIEKKLLEEIGRLTYHKDHATCPKCNLCGTCERFLVPANARLEQHCQTKKWVEELIDELISNENNVFVLWDNNLTKDSKVINPKEKNLNYDLIYYARLEILKELKKQLSGESK